jgi:hypothetical protein
VPPPGPAGPAPAAGARRRQGTLLLVALLLAFAIGDEVLVLTLKGRTHALQLVHRDTTGAAFEAAPDAARRVHADGVAFDYATGMDAARAAPLGVPAATGLDGGLDDVRRAVAWVRARLRSGEGYPQSRWRLEQAVAAAADPGRGFLCFSYACAVASVAEAQGYAARVVYLGRHITSEVFLPARGSWVMADATYDVIPHGDAGEPLSLLETRRRLVAGRPVEWRTVVGVRGDDDSLDAPTRTIVEARVRAGEFMVKDGALTFDLRSDRERLADVARGRPRVLQLALAGEPALDREERRLRALLVAWNGLALGVLALGAIALRPRAPGG